MKLVIYLFIKVCTVLGGEELTTCANCGIGLSARVNFCSNCGIAVQKSVKEEFTVSSDDLISKVKELLHESDVSRIIVKDEQGKKLLEIPVWAGIVGAVLAPWLAALGAIAALATDCTISVVRHE
jgi:hypothetical protein